MSSSVGAARHARTGPMSTSPGRWPTRRCPIDTFGSADAPTVGTRSSTSAPRTARCCAAPRARWSPGVRSGWRMAIDSRSARGRRWRSGGRRDGAAGRALCSVRVSGGGSCRRSAGADAAHCQLRCQGAEVDHRSWFGRLQNAGPRSAATLDCLDRASRCWRISLTDTMCSPPLVAAWVVSRQHRNSSRAGGMAWRPFLTGRSDSERCRSRHATGTSRRSP